MGDPVPSSAISDATAGGLSVIVITGGSTGDVLTLQSDGSYAPETPSASGGPPFDLGTVTSSTPFGITQTWNSGSVGFVGLFANFIDTASAAASYVIDLQKSGSTRLRTTKHGLTRCTFDTSQILTGLEVVGTNGTTYWTLGSVLSSGNANVQFDAEMAGSGQGRVNLGGGYLYLEGGPTTTGIRTFGALSLQPAALGGSGGVEVVGAINASGLVGCGVYTFSTVPAASANTGKFLRISDRAQRHAYSDGTNWRFFGDDAVIS